MKDMFDLVDWFIASLLILFGFSVHLIYDSYSAEIKIETNTEIKPKYKITIDGTKIDTTFIYTFKK